MGRGRVINIALVALVSSLILIIYVVPLIDFSYANPYWNGYSEVTSMLNGYAIDTPLTILSNYPPSNTCVVILPYEEYGGAELGALETFIIHGGTAIILSDYGYGNQILEYLGAPIRINTSGVLVDPLFHYRDRHLPIIRDIEDSLLGVNISSVVLNYASVLEARGGDARILAWSSPFSYLDLDLDSVLDEAEPNGPFPVLAEFSLGRGRVYVLSDPSIALNSMLDLGDNLGLLEALAGGREILIDQYHLRENIHYRIRMFILDVYDMLRRPPYIGLLTLALIIIPSYYIIKEFYGGA